MPVALALHALSATIWVGGMFFAYMALRPVAAQLLEPPLRLPLWSGTFARFFPWVWAAVVLLPATGYWMILGPFGGFAATPMYVHAMQAIGIAMILIFLHVYFAPYRRLRRLVETADYPAAAKQLAQIRQLIAINLVLGLVTIGIAVAGRHL